MDINYTIRSGWTAKNRIIIEVYYDKKRLFMEHTFGEYGFSALFEGEKIVRKLPRATRYIFDVLEDKEIEKQLIEALQSTVLLNELLLLPI